MARRCAKCDQPGVVYAAAGRYVCVKHAEEARQDIDAARLATDWATGDGPGPAETNAAAEQAATAHSFLDLCPGLRDPTELQRHLDWWRELENQ